MEFNNLITLIDLIGNNIKDEYKESLKINNIYASGKLYNSIDYRVEVLDGVVRLKFIALDYYLDIENGRKKGGKMPPLDVIKGWMITRNIPANNNTAYLIARSIARDGIEPKPYLREIRKNKLPSYTNEIQEALRADLKIYMETNLKLNKQ